MVNDTGMVCPICGGILKYHDRVRRILRSKGRASDYIQVRRMRCTKCGSIHRALPKFVIPYKQYEAEVINGVLEGYITPDTIGYEDYPCEATMARWIRTRNKQRLLLKEVSYLGKMKEWFIDHLGVFTDEELEDMGYTKEDIEILRSMEES